MIINFKTAVFGQTGLKACRLGLSGTCRHGKKAIYEAIDNGVNFLFCFGIDTQLIGVLEDSMPYIIGNSISCKGGKIKCRTLTM